MGVCHQKGAGHHELPAGGRTSGGSHSRSRPSNPVGSLRSQGSVQEGGWKSKTCYKWDTDGNKETTKYTVIIRTLF